MSSNIHEAEQRLAALRQTQQFTPPPPVDADEELRQFASDSCSDEGAVARCEASIGGGPSTQARLQARRFRPHVRGRAAGVDRETTGRFERGHVGVGDQTRSRRISNIMCQAAQQWQPGILPSMVSNSAS